MDDEDLKSMSGSDAVEHSPAFGQDRTVVKRESCRSTWREGAAGARSAKGTKSAAFGCPLDRMVMQIFYGGCHVERFKIYPTEERLMAVFLLSIAASLLPIIFANSTGTAFPI